MRWIATIGSAALAATVAACVDNSPPPVLSVSSSEVDRACVLASSDKLRALSRLEAKDGKAFEAPDGDASHRVVELNTTNAGLQVTYVFACMYDPRQSMAFASPMGRR